MGLFDGLDHSYGEHIHRRHWLAIESSANNLIMGSIRNLMRVAREGSLERWYVRKLDGLTWREDFTLAATSIIWSWPALVLNLATLPLAPVMTFLSGALLALSALYPGSSYQKGPDFISHGIVTLVQAALVMTVGTAMVVLSALSDVVCAIPVVGHVFRMMNKLIDGQYKLSGGSELPVGLQICTKLLKNQVRVQLVRSSLLDQLVMMLLYSGFDFMHVVRQRAQTADKKEIGQLHLESLVELKESYCALLVDLTCVDSLSSGQVMVVADLMNALQRLEEYKNETSLTRLFNATSAVSSGRVDAVGFLETLSKTNYLTEIKNACEESKNTEEQGYAQNIGELQQSLSAALASSYRQATRVSASRYSLTAARNVEPVRQPEGRQLLHC